MSSTRTSLTGRYPDFLCIGAQKAGTSWLHRQLLQHPDVWLPPFKEIHYFDQHKAGTRTSIVKGLKWRFSYLEKQRWRLLPRRVYRNLATQNFKLLAWDMTYYFRPRTDEWYRSLFRSDGEKLVGEITPDYSILDTSVIGDVREKMPDLKIVFLMRDPIDRAWSHTKMKLSRFQRRSLSSIDTDELLDFVTRRGVYLRSRYTRTLDNWSEIYTPEHFHLAFFEDIVDRPHTTLGDVLEFLGVDHTPTAIPESIDRKVHAGVRGEIPPVVEKRLAALMIDELTELESRFGGYTRDWLQRAEHVLAGQ